MPAFTTTPKVTEEQHMTMTEKMDWPARREAVKSWNEQAAKGMRSVFLPVIPPIATMGKWEKRDEDLCRVCRRGRRFWTEAKKVEDNSRCWTCHPPLHLRPSDIREKPQKLEAA
jgi:hypothetical protein